MDQRDFRSRNRPEIWLISSRNSLTVSHRFIGIGGIPKFSGQRYTAAFLPLTKDLFAAGALGCTI